LLSDDNIWFFLVAEMWHPGVASPAYPAPASLGVETDSQRMTRRRAFGVLSLHRSVLADQRSCCVTLGHGSIVYSVPFVKAAIVLRRLAWIRGTRKPGTK